MSVIKSLGRLSLAGLVRRAGFAWRQFRYRRNAHPTHFDWDWDAGLYNRVALVNTLIFNSRGPATRYLEIGCAGDALFKAVPCAPKEGVDPQSGGTRRMTSDAFFAQNSASFDVIFIDGLHHYKQVRRDTLNALACLNPGGWIAFHDFLPRSWKEHHVPRLQGTWMGDCWKLALELAHAKGIAFKIVHIDHGVGVLHRTGDPLDVPDFSAELQDAGFDVFVARLGELPIVDWTEAQAWIARAAGGVDGSTASA